MALQLAYIGLTLLMTIILILMGVKAIDKSFLDPSVAKSKKSLLITSLLSWQLYVFAIASTGMLENFDFPPKFVLFLVLPAFLFTGIFIYKNRNNNWIQNIPERWLVYYQTFRIAVELLLAYSLVAGILHSNVTIHGYNYDLIFAFTAPLVGYFVFQKKSIKPKVAIWWNYLGLLVIASIIFLFITTIYFPQLYGNEINLISTDFGKYPYVLVPGFLMPSAVFMHILSLVQLTKSSNSDIN